MSDKTTICIETCRNCAQHQWNTRHDERKYEQNFIWMQEALQKEIPGVVVLKNQIPVEWKNEAAFKGKIAPLTKETLELIPYIGAFEVRHEGTVLFSKLQAGCWPNCPAVATYVKSYLDQQNEDKKGEAKEKRNFGVTYTKSMVLLDKGGSTHQNLAATMPTKSKPLDSNKEDKKEEKKLKNEKETDDLFDKIAENEINEAQEEEKYPPETEKQSDKPREKEVQLSQPKESEPPAPQPEKFTKEEPTTSEHHKTALDKSKPSEGKPENEGLPQSEPKQEVPTKEDSKANPIPEPEAIPSEKKQEEPSKDIPTTEAPKQEEKKQEAGDDIIDNLADFGIDAAAEDA